MSKTAISVEGLSKLYRIGHAEEKHESLVSASIHAMKAPLRNFRKLWSLDASRSLTNGHPGGEDDLIWALRDVSFEVQRGEVLGVIGRNGAGKSTLLKILSRVTCPTSGRVVVNGRVSSLLEVGTGFHPELTGRDNIYLNGTILGMTRREIDCKFDEIVEFSGVSRFLDTPIKRYSSGMKVRLAFAVAAHLEPDILIIDEVLAVGDMEFQQKCVGKMKDMAGDINRTVLFVSHNMSTIDALCDRVVLLHGGRVKQFGETQSMIRAYLDEMSTIATTELDQRTDRDGDGRARCTRVWLHDETGRATDQVRCGDNISISMQYEVLQDDIPVLDFSLGLYDTLGVCLTRLSTQYVAPVGRFSRRGGVATCSLARLPLPPGEYSLNTSITGPAGERLDRVERAISFTVHQADFFQNGKLPSGPVAKFFLDHSWQLEGVGHCLPDSLPRGVQTP